MSKKKVLIIGSRGMLATKMAEIFNKDAEVETFVVGRHFSEEVEPEQSRIFRIEEDKPEFPGFDYIINCTGVIKPHIEENNNYSIARAMYVNSIFPHNLRAMTGLTPIIQIATDCVFSGRSTHGYDEDSPHDALDVYGKTKSLGEVKAPLFYNIRCSIVGREKFGNKSLLEWFLSQPLYSSLQGYTNHYWNGITTKAFSKICLAIVKNDIPIPFNFNLTPADMVTKAQLLKYFELRFQHTQSIKEFDTYPSVNRTLKSGYNMTSLWNVAGYNSVPTIWQLIQEID